MDFNEPQWRTNTSFSPPLSRRWDRRFQPDGMSRVTNRVPIYGSSASSHSRGSRRGVSSDPNPNHHHSVSDGALAYFGSPSDNHQLQAPRWTPPLQRYDLGEFSTPTGGPRSDSFVYRQLNGRHFPVGFPSVPSSLGTPSPLSESSRWASTSKQPIFFPPCNFSNRRSFMSKPVYPIIFRNPVSDSDTAETSKSLTHLPTASSSRRDGFRWSNASSNESDTDIIGITDCIGLENAHSPVQQHKCGLCQRPLSQKSPWSSNRVLRSTVLPVAGVLPCRHVFHAECLDETTPKNQLHDPPCPLCEKVDGVETRISFSEPLFVRRRSGQSAVASSSGVKAGSGGGDTKRSRRGGSSSLKNQIKKRLNFRT